MKVNAPPVPLNVSDVGFTLRGCVAPGETTTFTAVPWLNVSLTANWQVPLPTEVTVNEAAGPVPEAGEMVAIPAQLVLVAVSAPV